MTSRLPSAHEIAASGKPVRRGDRFAYPVTFLASAAESGAIDLRGQVPVAIIFDPTDWTEADIGFAGSMDGVNFYPLIDMAGNAVVTAAPAGTALVALPHESLLGFRFLQLRSLDTGDGSPEAQVNEVSITVVTLP